MAFNIVNDSLTLGELRTIVDSNKPFDTGFLFNFGNRYNETNEYMVAIYDLNVVPYIQFLEEGTKYSNKHQGFISVDTVGQINAGVQDMGILESKNMKRSSLISQGVLEHTINFGQQGGRYDRLIGIT